MKAKVLILIVSLVFSSCSNRFEKEKYPKDFFNIIQEGILIEKSYIFCSVVPKEVKYSYRDGAWIFRTAQNKKIAQGNYNKEIVTIDNYGGCSYSYIKNTVNIKEWKFWNDKGQRIEPTERLISMIKSGIFNHNKAANKVYN
ncbi:hypothetical protein ACOSP6_00235 [Tenacibaculum sp. MEBiC06402]|uniref:hypothetical protein n=1 Tax=Tenacibaculum sp. MEBiC06402 TaxID=3412023 RepID=UPI003B9D27C8